MLAFLFFPPVHVRDVPFIDEWSDDHLLHLGSSEGQAFWLIRREIKPILTEQVVNAGLKLFERAETLHQYFAFEDQFADWIQAAT